jgi:Protein of unknown function (DUF1592)/Protein of unknown function (DUF1588)/Protein of unknown function (DUF1587)/Protein of unknown function (DUF1585)/Protein of unknown function (DUF1595)/Planctomycete cytochrome C
MRFALFFFIATVASAAPPPALMPFLKSHCYDCHDADTKKGGLDLDELSADLGNAAAMAKWVRLLDRVDDEEMPPKKRKTQPSDAERNAFVGAVSRSLTKWDVAMKGTVLRRLNRTEYENTLRDLLGVRTELKTLLPEDGKAFGFDNVGEALDLSPVHMQRYMDAANAALRDAVKFGPAPEKKTVSAPFDSGRNAENVGKHWHKLSDGAVVFFTNGGFPEIKPEFSAPVEGLYRVKITGHAFQSDDDATFSVYAGTFGRNGDTHLVDVLQLPSKQTTRTLEVYLHEKEKLRVIPELVPDQTKLRSEGPANYKGKGLALMPFEIEGPIFEEWPGSGHKLLFGKLEASETAGSKSKEKFRNKSNGPKRTYELVTQDAAADAKRLLAAFVPKAFRRPVGDEKIAPYLKLAQAELASGSSFYDAMMTGYVAVLCSPDFLYLKEPVGKLDDFAIASRLSYMLWSSAPDAELIALAAKKHLSAPDTLRSQTERLLADARAERFTKNFTGQWLNLRDIDFTTPDKQLYPEYDDTLKNACLKETELFFNEVLRGNLSVANFVDSNWTMLNERLARHYGIDGVEGAEFRKVSLTPEAHRGGVLTQMSVLKVSANGTSTSPVIRGSWVLSRILGTPPPPPPPGVPGVEPDIRGAQTLRQQLDKHRNLESCNGCHRSIDAPGFALENYDVIGGWRERYRSLGKDFPKPTKIPANVRNVQWRIGPPVDATGETPDGKKFNNLTDYKKLILAQPQNFTRALAEKLAVYASGRGMGFSDRAELNRIASATFKKGNGLHDLVHEVVQSEIFRNK